MKPSIFFIAISLVFLLQIVNSKEFRDIIKEWGKIDFIIIGAGTAGSIVAARLVEAGHKVLVIEAGYKPPNETTTSRFYRQYLKTVIDWQYETEPQEHALFGYPNRKTTISAGKLMGGSGSMNAMVYLRGIKYDYDNWENMGATGWGYDSLLPYIKKIEDSHLSGKYDPNDHNRGGYIKVTNEGNDKPILNSFKEAVKRKGYKEIDPNNGEGNGFGPMQFNYYNNKRQSTYRKYLLPLKKQKDKLLILSGALAQKIKYDEKLDKNIVEILVEKSGEVIEASADKEVILCAGAINTPQILMLSGIGPKKELMRHKIPVVANLPVGKNFHEHFGVLIPAFKKENSNESGAVVAFVKSDESKERHDIEMFHYLMNDYLFAITFLLGVESRGEVRLRSLNIRDKPIVDPKYLSNKNDLKRLGKAQKMMSEFLQQMDLKKNETGYTRLPSQIPEPCKTEKYDNFWECIVKYVGTTTHHPVGTARMGAPGSLDSVVDPNLKVIGFKRLRVVDASVMPAIVSANTQVAVMAIAEKAADLILSDI